MCLFCDKENSVDESEFCKVYFDGFPVTRYHLLIVPKRHVETFFGLTPEEINDTIELLNKWKNIIGLGDETITGWNIGWNCDKSAGQTIDHAHCHLIPRRDGDCDDPVGGVRGCIPSKMNYKEDSYYE